MHRMLVALFLMVAPAALALEIAGITTTPHMMLDTMQFRIAPEPADGARVQLFLLNNGDALTFDGATRVLADGRAPSQLLSENAWAWHDTPSATPDATTTLPQGAMTVWTFNGRVKPFGTGGAFAFEAGPEGAPWVQQDISLEEPQVWISAITFLAPEDQIHPNRFIVHVANESDAAADLVSCRLWLPPDPAAPRVLLPQAPVGTLDCFNGHATIPPSDRGGFSAKVDPLPLTYAVVEVRVRQGGDEQSLWSYLRIKPERFDISGGWVNDGRNVVTQEPFLKALKRLYVNTAHMGITQGYSDTPLYEKYPLKYFGALKPFEQYDTDAMLPHIHAAEFLGEPQYGGGRPVPPQEVWRDLQPYAATRLATSITHSEERIWRDYAGLSDYPHYDAYRVTAPSADAWFKYTRWGDARIGWGAPLETIGDMSRSLRELNRPMPCAYWSQGPHDWDVYGGRKRTTPTADEIRMQAYHALSTRITSLYWFNLSLKSITDWRDTLDAMGRIGREMRMIDDLLIESDACHFERTTTRRGKLDWDVATVAGPKAALLFALDLDYVPDEETKVFTFGEPRKAEWSFVIPAYLGEVADVFRMDADGVYDADWKQNGATIAVKEKANKAVVYIAARDAGLRAEIEAERQRLVAEEAVLGFDPARNDADFQALVDLLPKE